MQGRKNPRYHSACIPEEYLLVSALYEPLLCDITVAPVTPTEISTRGSQRVISYTAPDRLTPAGGSLDGNSATTAFCSNAFEFVNMKTF